MGVATHPRLPISHDGARGAPRGVGNPRARTSARAGGFTFIELIVVMGVLAMLMGLTVKFIKGEGRVGALAMARTQLLDAARRAQGNSRGEKIAVLTFRRSAREEVQGGYEVFTTLSEGVLTHSFETQDGASRSLPMKVHGEVKIEPGGRPGSCARFGRGGALEFEPQSSFAMTDGLDIELWIAPDAGSNVMTLVEGQGAYELALVRSVTGDYDVRLRLNLRPMDGPGEPTWTIFETAGAPVKVTGRWQHLHARYNGFDASFKVDDLEFVKAPTASRTEPTRAGPKARRIGVPPEGAVTLTIGATGQTYVGRMDGLVVRGVFRLAEDNTELPDSIEVEVLEPAKSPLPFQVTYVNGRLDPLQHATDVRIRFADRSRPDDPPLILTLGRHGTFSADYGRASNTVAEPTAPAPKSSDRGGPR